MLGFSLLFGGSGRLDRESSLHVSLGLVAFATSLFLIPAIPGFEGDPDRRSLAVLSVPVSIVLLLVYVGVTWYSLRRHRGCTSPTSRCRQAASRGRSASRWRARRSPRSSPRSSPRRLVHTLEVFAEEVGLSEFFVAAVIVAIVGNAAEHGGAVVVAYRGNIKLAAEIALASSAQVAVFLIPAVALLSWAIEPLSLSFRARRAVGVLAVSVVFTTACSRAETRADSAAPF